MSTQFKVGDKVVANSPCVGKLRVGKVYTVLRINATVFGENVVIEGSYEDGDEPCDGIESYYFDLAPTKKRDYVADHARRTLRKAGLTKVEAARYVENYKRQSDGKEDFPSLSEFSRKIPERFAYSRSGFVLGGFAWADTPEGVDYWSAIDDRLTKGEHAQAQP